MIRIHIIIMNTILYMCMDDDYITISVYDIELYKYYIFV